ncbi:MAG TPA: carboxypeptidase regulatory-like domain-containing protein [Terracidiphilus sp.]|jgi:hypothetical protein|nr:carboxypeptidase regulatory-like domain-containing protein [Terracidiphilus sp.]
MKRLLTHRIALAALAAVAAILGSIPANAVGPTGKIVGSVYDPTGAPVAGASVTATNEGTGEARQIASDSSGNFAFPILPVGNYKVKVAATGFQAFEQTGIVLQVDQNVTVNVHLQVGSSSEVVQVSADTGQNINLVDATISQVVDSRRVVDLPLNGRDTLQLQYIMPGVSYDNDSVAHGQGQHEGVVVNGNRPGSNYYLLDGVDMTDSYLSVAPVFPAPDALQEFDIQTSNFTAQYGRSSGGVINAVSRAGTNAFHGGAFEFFRNTVLDSHNYFDVPGEAKPALKLNQFGGYLGGPIIKQKTFFFGYYQGTRQRKDETVTIGTVLTQQENPVLNGGVSQFPANTIVDPQTGKPFATDGLIPANRIDPTAYNAVKALLPYLPNNSTGGYTYHAPSADNEDDLNENQYLVRIDHNLNTNNLIFGRYFFNQDYSTGYGAGNINLPHDKYFRNQNVALDWNHTFTQNLINTAVMGFTRVAHHRGTINSDGWDTFGALAGAEAPGIPTEFYIGVNGSYSNGGDGTFVQNRQTWQYTDYLSYLHGKHSIAVGGDFRKEAVNRVEDYFTDPIFDFNGTYTGPGGQGNSVTSMADMLMGLPNYFNLQTEVRSDLRHKAMDLYVQDSYKVNQHVIIDAGFRWEPFLPPVDNLNDQICFDPTLKTQSTFYPTAPPGFTFPGPPLSESVSTFGRGDSGCPRAMVPDRWKNVAPRLGVNYSPFASGKTSIRAAFGIFWDQARLIAWNRYSTAQPFDENYEITGLAVVPSQGALTGTNIFTANPGQVNPFPFVVPRTRAQRQAFSPQYGGYWPTSAEGTVLPPNFNEGYDGQWNLSVDQEFARNWVLTVSYIGNHGTHLFLSRDINWAPLASYNSSLTLAQNQLDENYRRLFAYDGNCGTSTVINPVPNPATGSYYDNPCLGQTQEEANQGWSNYDAVDFTVNHRFTNGFSLLASYVYGKYLDIISYGAEGGLGPRNPLNFGQSYGPSDSDVRNRVTASYIYMLPKVKSAHGVVSGLINNWQNQGIFVDQTGSPYSIGSYTDTGATGIGGDLADLVPGVSWKPAHRGVKSYFNTAAFVEAANGTYGTSSRGILYGPSKVNFDFSLFKEFPIHEDGKIQFRSEFFNVFNHPNFGNPDSTVGDGTFGQLTGASDGRIAQFALKYLF